MEFSQQVSHLTERMKHGAVALLGVAALMGGMEADHADAKVVKSAHIAQNHIDGTLPTSCDTETGLALSLHGPEIVRPAEKNTFKIVAKSCREDGKKAYKHIDIKWVVSAGKKKALKRTIEDVTLAPGKSVTKTVEFAFPKRSLAPVVKATATNEHGKPIKRNKWTLKYKTGAGSETPVNVKPPIPKVCRPNPNFFKGIGDDQAFVEEAYGPREQLFAVAKKLGFTALRINIPYSDWYRHQQKYIDTVQAAANADIKKLHITVMQDARYFHNPLPYSVSYQNRDPAKTAEFSRSVASTIGSLPVRSSLALSYAIFNEINIADYTTDLGQDWYPPVYTAGRNAIKEVDPTVPVYAGELAPSELGDRLLALDSVANDGKAIHPYFGAMAHLEEYAKMSKTPIIITEYGNGADNKPIQVEYNNLALKAVSCILNTEGIYYWQMIETPKAKWNTGQIAQEEIPGILAQPRSSVSPYAITVKSKSSTSFKIHRPARYPSPVPAR